MADYNINAITRRVVYTGSAGLGPYAFSFEIIDQADVGVYFNQTALTLSSDYTVTINANGTGSVNIITGGNVPSTPTANDTIIIIGARDIERTTDFVTAGDLLASSLNEQLDSNIIFEQQIDERVDRSIKFPVYDSFTGDNVLPAAAARSNKVLGFTNDGGVTTSTNTLAQFDAAVSSFVNATGNNAASIFYDPAGSGAEQTTVQAKLREVVSVKDFGATGDGVTDDTTAIQACLNAASLGSAIFFPEGDYVISSALDMTSLERMTLFGAGWRASKIRQVTADTSALKLPQGPSLTGSNNTVVRDLSILGQNANTTGWGIEVVKSSRASIIGCIISGWGYTGSGGGGIYVKDSIVLDVIDCQIGSCYYGIYNDVPTFSGWNGGTVAGCYISSIKAQGIWAYALNGISFTGTTFESCFGGGLYIDTAGGGLSFNGCYFEENKTIGGAGEYYDIYIGASSYVVGVSITGCYFNGNNPASTEDYIPIRMKYAVGVFLEANLLNVGNKFVKFANSAVVNDIHLGALGLNPAGGGGATYSSTNTFGNLPSNFYEPTLNNYNHYENTFLVDQAKQRSGSVPCAIDIWTTAVTGTGSVTSEGTGIIVNSGATAGSTAIASTIIAPSLGLGQASYDYGKICEIEFIVSNIASGTTNGKTWIRFSNQITAADPSARAFGFRIDGNALKGIVCDNSGSLTVLDLATNISAGLATSLKVINKLNEVEFFVNGVSKGTQSLGANLTSPVSTALVLSVTNGADAAQHRIGVYDIKYHVTQ